MKRQNYDKKLRDVFENVRRAVKITVDEAETPELSVKEWDVELVLGRFLKHFNDLDKK